MDKFEELKSIVEGIQADIEKFYEKDTKAAGVRARKGLQDIKKVAQEIRVDIAERRKTL